MEEEWSGRILSSTTCVVHAPPLHHGSDGLCVVFSVVLILPLPSLMYLSIFCRFCDVFFWCNILCRSRALKVCNVRFLGVLRDLGQFLLCLGYFREFTHSRASFRGHESDSPMDLMVVALPLTPLEMLTNCTDFFIWVR